MLKHTHTYVSGNVCDVTYAMLEGLDHLYLDMKVWNEGGSSLPACRNITAWCGWKYAINDLVFFVTFFNYFKCAFKGSSTKKYYTLVDSKL